MNKDQEYVEFPCQKTSWIQVCNLLEGLKDVAQQPNSDLQKFCTHHQRIVDINNGFIDPDDVAYNQTTLYGLGQFLEKKASPEERRRFLQSTLPAIIDLVLEIPNLIPPEGVPIVSQQCAADLELNRPFVACILACAFLCLFEERKKPWKSKDCKLNVINFSNFYKHLPSPPQNAKLRCILEYFDEISDRGYDLHGNIRFIRQVIPRSEQPSLDSWLNCEIELCPLIAHHEGCIENACPDAIEIDFANRFIGGGVIGMGKVQEEIRFTVCPELICSMLFMESMEENEAIIIQGYEQFSQTEGYSSSLQFAGKYKSSHLYDTLGNLCNTLCAIDAVSYRSHSDRQYQDEYCIRDINKAYVGFSSNVDRRVSSYPVTNTASHDEVLRNFDQSKPDLNSVHSDFHQLECMDSVPSYGRLVSQSEEEFYTASENEEEKEDLYISNSISNLADGIMADILSNALLEASSIIHKQHEQSLKKFQKKANISIDDDNRTSSSSGSKTDSLDNMDHLDVDLRDWVTKFRRRSSNLSDIGSRRSSCSTRYSSDFSSEFEEYYDNFQRKEQQVRHNTITEEICHPVIADYAANLIAKVLREGTTVAANKMINVQKFDSIPHSAAKKPVARKVSEESESGALVNDELSSPDIGQSTVEKFANSLLNKLLVFPDGGPNESFNISEQNISTSQDIPVSSSSSAMQTTESSKDSVHDVCNRPSDQNLPVISNSSELHTVAGDIVHSAVTNAVSIYRDTYHANGYSESELEDMVVMASSFSSKHSTDSEISQASSAPGSSFFQNRGNSDLFGIELNCDKVESVIDCAVSPSKSEKKNVQFHKDVVQREINAHYPVLQNSCEDSHSRTVSESSTSVDSTGQHIPIPKLIVSEELSPRNGIEEIYGRVAEKLILSGFSSALKDVHDKTGRSYDGASITFSATENQPEHSVYVQGGNLVYPGEILRGESYEDVNNPQRVICFASTLSRDLLTNAFIEVQRNVNGGSYARRSSEPLKISNQAARQLMEENNGSHNYKEKSKSRTEEDLGAFAKELAHSSFEEFRDLHSHHSCGFRDPTLSRFAEELMKTECKVPELKLLDSTNVSVSGSSFSSFQSSKSGFRDPLLSSFEGELLSSSYGRSSTRGSLKRKNRSGSLKKKVKTGETVEGIDKGRLLDDSRGVSFESDVSILSWRSFPSVSLNQDEITGFAEKLAEKILKESLQSALRNTVVPLQTSTELPSCDESQKNMGAEIAEFADIIALEILTQAFQAIVSKNRQESDKYPDEDEDSGTGSPHHFSGEYWDAMTVPYTEVEQFAESIAFDIVQSSISYIQREKRSAPSRRYGRPIATGNWGCGAFHGDPHLKAMLQWMAASYAGVPYLLFYTFQHERLVQLQDVIDSVLARGWRVGQLMQAIRTYCMACQDLSPSDRPDLFQLLLDKNSFQDIT